MNQTPVMTAARDSAGDRRTFSRTARRRTARGRPRAGRRTAAGAAGVCTVGGILHGGAIMGFADTLGVVGTFLNQGPGSRTTTIESSTNFIGERAGGLGAHR